MTSNTSTRPALANTAAKAPVSKGVASPSGIDLDQPLALLGGLSPQVFMRRHWQKKPLLIRQAMPGVKPPLERSALFALAAEDEVESRLIVQTGLAGKSADKPKGSKKALPPSGKAKLSEDPGWRMSHGPLTRRQLPPLNQPGWTLLVQGLDLHVPAAHEMLQAFRFVPDARMDDLMVSYASAGGGVGPHFDSYDVFLLQVHGQRRWRVGPLKDASLQPDVPLKILSNFEPDEEWVLEAGDMLYLPPRWAHDGVAVGEDCMTCSIGFRAPDGTELARELVTRWMEGLDAPETHRLYTDPKQEATGTPGLLPASLQAFAADAVARVLKDPHALNTALGELLTEPKPRVWFEQGEPLPNGVGVRLDARTRMVYDELRVFANGESWRAAGKDARHLRLLADRRSLDAKTMAQLSPAVRELLEQWAEDGWLHPQT